MSEDDCDAMAIAAWEDDGGHTNAGAMERETLSTGHRDAPPPTTYLSALDQCSALRFFGRQPRGN